ncbi:MAG: CsgG/HfaB family protein [Hasllibacter sp.]
MRRALRTLGLAAALAACQSPDAPRASLRGPVPVVARTPADPALACLAARPEVRGSEVVFAVHAIVDQTGKTSIEETGAWLPRDASAMLVTALARAGVRQVNRTNTAVPEWELSLAREQVLGDVAPAVVAGRSLDFRPIHPGGLRGSTVVIDGALTQLDFNTWSEGAEAAIMGGGGGARAYALTVGADLRVTDTVTTDLLMARAYSKQAVGREVFASVFRFFDDELFDVRIGRHEQEGLHAGLRWMLAEAAYDIVAAMTGHDGSCDALLPR